MLTALVTGANGVFGRHICSGLVKQGFDVVAVVRDEAKGAALTSQVGGSCSYLVADMSCGASIGTLAASFGSGRPLHALVNNAAITPTSRLESAEGIELQWSVNVLAYHRLVKAFLPQLKAAAGGGSRAVFVASFYAGGLDLADPEFKATAYSADAAYRRASKPIECSQRPGRAQIRERAFCSRAVIQGLPPATCRSVWGSISIAARRQRWRERRHRCFSRPHQQRASRMVVTTQTRGCHGVSSAATRPAAARCSSCVRPPAANPRQEAPHVSDIAYY